MEFETIRVEVDGELGRLILNRPDRLNAIGQTMLCELADAARWFDGQSDVRVVIVQGEGRAFSAGADLKDRAGRAESWIERREVGQRGLRMADAIEQMRAVTIARVQGWAIGGGVVLMSACDLRVVADDALLMIPEIDLGIPLAWGGIPRLVREIGPARAKEWVMTCDRITAAAAREAGFVNRVVPEAELDACVDALARQLLAKPAVPLVITKEHVNAVARSMSSSASSFSDGDALVGTGLDPESRKAGQEYAARTLRGSQGD